MSWCKKHLDEYLPEEKCPYCQAEALRTRLEEAEREKAELNMYIASLPTNKLEILEKLWAENADLRTRLEKAQKMLDNTIDDLQNSAEKNLDFEAENADLRNQLEQTERERENYKFSCEYTEAERDTVRVENATLKQKLVAVREWVKLYDPDWNNDINILKKILD